MITSHVVVGICGSVVWEAADLSGSEVDAIAVVEVTSDTCRVVVEAMGAVPTVTAVVGATVAVGAMVVVDTS